MFLISSSKSCFFFLQKDFFTVFYSFVLNHEKKVNDAAKSLKTDVDNRK